MRSMGTTTDELCGVGVHALTDLKETEVYKDWKNSSKVSMV